MKSLEIVAASASLTVGMKCAILVNRSTTTKMDVWPLDEGNCTMRSIDMDDHGVSGMGKGCGIPYGLCWGFLFRWQVSQEVTNY